MLNPSSGAGSSRSRLMLAEGRHGLNLHGCTGCDGCARYDGEKATMHILLPCTTCRSGPTALTICESSSIRHEGRKRFKDPVGLF